MDSRNVFEVALERILADDSPHYEKAQRLMQLSNEQSILTAPENQNSTFCLEKAIKLFKSSLISKQKLDPAYMFGINANICMCHIALMNNLLRAQDYKINKLNYKEITSHFFQYCTRIKKSKILMIYLNDEVLYSSLEQNLQTLYNFVVQMKAASPQAAVTCLKNLASVYRSIERLEQEKSLNENRLTLIREIIEYLENHIAQLEQIYPKSEQSKTKEKQRLPIESMRPHFEALKNADESFSRLKKNFSKEHLENTKQHLEVAVKGSSDFIKNHKDQLDQRYLFTLQTMLNRTRANLIAVHLVDSKKMDQLDYNKITDYFIESCNIYKDPSFCGFYLQAYGPETFLNEVNLLIKNAHDLIDRNPQEALICYEHVINIFETLFNLNKHHPQLFNIKKTNENCIHLFLNKFEMVNKVLIDSYTDATGLFPDSKWQIERLAFYNRRLYNVLSDNNLFIYTKDSAGHFKTMANYFEKHNAPLEAKIANDHLKNLTQMIEHPELNEKLAKTQTRLSLKEKRPRSSSSTKGTTSAFFNVPAIDKAEDSSTVKKDAGANQSPLIDTPKKKDLHQ